MQSQLLLSACGGRDAERQGECVPLAACKRNWRIGSEATAGQQRSSIAMAILQTGNAARRRDP